MRRFNTMHIHTNIHRNAPPILAVLKLPMRHLSQVPSVCNTFRWDPTRNSTLGHFHELARIPRSISELVCPFYMPEAGSCALITYTSSYGYSVNDCNMVHHQGTWLYQNCKHWNAQIGGSQSSRAFNSMLLCQVKSMPLLIQLFVLMYGLFYSLHSYKLVCPRSPDQRWAYKLITIIIIIIVVYQQLIVQSSSTQNYTITLTTLEPPIVLPSHQHLIPVTLLQLLHIRIRNATKHPCSDCKANNGSAVERKHENHVPHHLWPVQAHLCTRGCPEWPSNAVLCEYHESL